MRRNAALDLGKFIASIFIVGIHTTLFKSVSPEMDFFFTQIVFRMAVPFFLLCSGYFFAQKMEKLGGNTAGLLKNTERKWIGMYVLWAIIYLIAVIPNWIETGWMSPNAFMDWGLAFVKNGSYYHLWYLLCIIYAFPVFYLLLKKCRTSLLIVIMLFLYCIEAIAYGYRGFFENQTLQKLFEIGDWLSCFLAAFTRCLPFLLLGALIARLKTKNIKTWIQAGGLSVSFLGLCAEAYLLKHFEQERFSYIFFTLPVAFFLFMFIKSCNLPDTSKHIYKKMANVSMYIYLVHPLVILILKEYISNSMLLFTVTCILSIAVSVFCVKIKQLWKGKKKNV